jgi:hypothetical protein
MVEISLSGSGGGPRVSPGATRPSLDFARDERDPIYQNHCVPVLVRQIRSSFIGNAGPDRALSVSWPRYFRCLVSSA